MITAILILIILLLFAAILFMRFKNMKMLDRIDSMLDAAIENRFSESEFSADCQKQKQKCIAIYLSGKPRFHR